MATTPNNNANVDVGRPKVGGYAFRAPIGTTLPTDATTALRRHIRSVTIMGMDENGLPAFSHTLDDVPENVNGDQVADIVEMVTELIRQS